MKIIALSLTLLFAAHAAATLLPVNRMNIGGGSVHSKRTLTVATGRSNAAPMRAMRTTQRHFLITVPGPLSITEAHSRIQTALKLSKTSDAALCPEELIEIMQRLTADDRWSMARANTLIGAIELWFHSGGSAYEASLIISVCTDSCIT
jgi:hypothetical protein